MIGSTTITGIVSLDRAGMDGKHARQLDGYKLDNYNYDGTKTQKDENSMEVPVGVWIFAAIIVVILAWITFWITNKAYSRKWEESDQDMKGGHM